TLADDLRRRDFGLNALALLVGVDGSVTLLDEVGGLDDLRGRVLRPLHPRSFHEDASRLVRGARLAGRLGLAAHPELLRQLP
ncbi:CCA tRNA nucleotidyltransferase, partial [Staphylococcus aureus]|nr:CCA tRNA nucleotidyltransferase [Staphylococcus aureus]